MDLKSKLQSSLNDANKSSAIQDTMAKERQREVSTSIYARRFYQDQKNRNLANKAEWVKRGRRPEDRADAIDTSDYKPTGTSMSISAEDWDRIFGHK